MPDKPFRDPLTDLRARLEETRRAAEQLAGEVEDAREQERAANGADAPPAARRCGDPPPGGADGREELRDDVAAMAQMVAALVELVPDELREQVYEILRQILLLLRALIDWLVDRLPQVRGSELVVEDIPVS